MSAARCGLSPRICPGCGLRRVLMLDPDLSVVGEARDGIEALELVGRLHPEVVLRRLQHPRRRSVSAMSLYVSSQSPPVPQA